MSTEFLTYETLTANAVPGDWSMTLMSADCSDSVTIVYDEELQRDLMGLIESKRMRLHREDAQRARLRAAARNLAVSRGNAAVAAADAAARERAATYLPEGMNLWESATADAAQKATK